MFVAWKVKCRKGVNQGSLLNNRATFPLTNSLLIISKNQVTTSESTLDVVPLQRVEFSHFKSSIQAIEPARDQIISWLISFSKYEAPLLLSWGQGITSCWGKYRWLCLTMPLPSEPQEMTWFQKKLLVKQWRLNCLNLSVRILFDLFHMVAARVLSHSECTIQALKVS